MTLARHLATGRRGEELAKKYLEHLGWRIVGENVRVGSSEIDLIAQDGGTTVFVEVKTRVGDAYGSPEESVTERKIERLMRGVIPYLRRHNLSVVRFDVVAIQYLPGYPRPKLRHLRGLGDPQALAFLQ